MRDLRGAGQGVVVWLRVTGRWSGMYSEASPGGSQIQGESDSQGPPTPAVRQEGAAQA